MKELLAQRARDEHNRESETIAKAITLYLTKNLPMKAFLSPGYTQYALKLVQKLLE